MPPAGSLSGEIAVMMLSKIPCGTVTSRQSRPQQPIQQVGGVPAATWAQIILHGQHGQVRVRPAADLVGLAAHQHRRNGLVDLPSSSAGFICVFSISSSRFYTQLHFAGSSFLRGRCRLRLGFLGFSGSWLAGIGPDALHVCRRRGAPRSPDSGCPRGWLAPLLHHFSVGLLGHFMLLR